MTDTDLPAIIAHVRELSEAATPGPWRALRDGNSLVGNRPTMASRIEEVARPHNPLYCGGPRPAVTVMRDADADLVSFYRTAAPALADEVERLRERVVELEAERHPLVGAEPVKCFGCYSKNERIAELEEVIAKHRYDVWGDGDVEHLADEELYAALKGGG